MWYVGPGPLGAVAPYKENAITHRQVHLYSSTVLLRCPYHGTYCFEYGEYAAVGSQQGVSFQFVDWTGVTKS